MRQAIHIFSKDVRHLWPQVLISQLLIVAHAYLAFRVSPFDFENSSSIKSSNALIAITLPLILYFLVALVVYQETLPGDRQFWLTRPYRRTSLIASKVLFVLVFVNFPLLLSDCCLLGANGFSVIGVASQLLIRQLHITLIFVLPSFAAAALTTGPLQFLMAWFAVLLGLIAENAFGMGVRGGSSFNLVGIEFAKFVFYASALLIFSVIAWQYTQRRTRAARIAAFAVALVYLPALIALTVSSGLPEATNDQEKAAAEPAVRIEYDRTPTMTGSSGSSSAGTVSIPIPLRVDGLPPNSLLRGSGMTSIYIDGKAWPWPEQFEAAHIERNGGHYTQNVQVRTLDVEALRGKSIRLSTNLYFQIVTDLIEKTESVNGQSFIGPNGVLCRTSRINYVVQFACGAGLQPSVETDVKEIDHSPFPIQIAAEHGIPWGLTPLTAFSLVSLSETPDNVSFAVIPRRRLAAFERTVEGSNLTIPGYLIPPH